MTDRPSVTQFARTSRRDGITRTMRRPAPEEVPIALSYGGTTHAVMMASPGDLEDFGIGFSITEGIVSEPDEIESIEIEDLDKGIEVRIRLKDEANQRFQARRRILAGPVGCGLCGIESIEEAMRSVRSVADGKVTMRADNIARAVARLARMQPIHSQTSAVHAAGFYLPGSNIVAVREDVGRHNALDKLAGALAREGIDASNGAVIVTSRLSVELVQKTASIGSPILLGISAPTALAIRTAQECGMTLVGLVRDEDFDVFTFPKRIRLRTANAAA